MTAIHMNGEPMTRPVGTVLVKFSPGHHALLSAGNSEQFRRKPGLQQHPKAA